ncbi:NACHT C-terminal helical domain 2-containing protein, partial [Nostoc sp.]
WPSELGQDLQNLLEQIPDRHDDGFIKWWDKNFYQWNEQLRMIMIKHRNIGHNWQFSVEQKQLLQQYCNANLLLINCLNIDSAVSNEIQSKIKESLLLPIAEIEKRKRETAE